MKNKNYLKNDDGKIRDCYANVAKMNILEHMKFYWITQKEYRHLPSYILENLKDLWEGLFPLITNLIFFLTFPISIPLKSYYHIRHAKKQCSKNVR